MQIFSSITLACLFTLSAGGCLAPSSDPADDVATAAADLDDPTGTPRCPDQSFDLPGTPLHCVLPGGAQGQRPCTDHDTIHYGFSIGPPPDFQVTCVETSFERTTTCSATCQPIGLP